MSDALRSGPGWSLLRVVGLGVLGIGIGTLIGALTGATAVVGSSGPETRSFTLIAAVVGGSAGAALSGVAALGALCALVVGDHWGTRGPRARALIAALGAAVTISVLGLTLVTIDDFVSSVWFLSIAAFGGAVCAGTGLFLFERRMRRHATQSARALSLF